MYIVKLVFTGVYIFLIFALKHTLWVRTINVLSKNKKEKLERVFMKHFALNIMPFTIGINFKKGGRVVGWGVEPLGLGGYEPRT